MNNKPARTAKGLAAVIILYLIGASILVIAAVPVVLAFAYFSK
jgi:hypothetical protein